KIRGSARPCGRNFDRLRFLGFPWGIGHGVSFRAAGERLRLHLLLWRWRQSASSADLGAQEQTERPHRQAGLEIAARAIGEERIEWVSDKSRVVVELVAHQDRRIVVIR